MANATFVIHGAKVKHAFVLSSSVDTDPEKAEGTATTEKLRRLTATQHDFVLMHDLVKIFRQRGLRDPGMLAVYDLILALKAERFAACAPTGFSDEASAKLRCAMETYAVCDECGFVSQLGKMAAALRREVVRKWLTYDCLPEEGLPASPAVGLPPLPKNDITIQTRIEGKAITSPEDQRRNQKNTITAPDSSISKLNSKVCSFVYIPLALQSLSHTHTSRFARASLQWLREASLSTLRKQGVNVIVIIDTGKNAELKDIVEEELLNQKEAFYNVFVDYLEKAYEEAFKFEQRVVNQSSCPFVSTSRLDADDIIHPHLFEGMHQHILNEFNKNPSWNGGFYANRDAKNYKLLLGGDGSCAWRKFGDQTR